MPGQHTGAFTTGPGGNLGYFTTEPQEPTQPSVVGSIVQITPSDEDMVMRYDGTAMTFVPLSEASATWGKEMVSIEASALKELIEAAQPFADLANALDEKDPDIFQIHIRYDDDALPCHEEHRSAAQLRRLLQALQVAKSL